MRNDMNENPVAEQASSLTGKKRSKKKPLIGINPLDWLKDDELKQTELPEADENGQAAQAVEQNQKQPQKSENEMNAGTDADSVTDQLDDQIIEDDVMKLEGPVTIADVAELHERFRKLLAAGQPVAVDCSELDGLDASALQLFVAFTHKAGNQGIAVEWKNPSATFKTAAQLVGLTQELRI